MTPVLVRGDAERRAAIIERGRNLLREIRQTFLDCDHWNRHVRRPGEQLIDVDPYGELRSLAAALEEQLANDSGVGPIAPLKSWVRL